jgi:hypothetical protein
MIKLTNIIRDFKKGYSIGSESAEISNMISTAYELIIFAERSEEKSFYSKKFNELINKDSNLKKTSGIAQKAGYHIARFIEVDPHDYSTEY